MKNKDVTNPWSVVIEYLKIIITLSAGFLALTVTFISQTLNLKTDPIPCSLIICWAFLVVTIAFSLYSVAKLSNFLRGKGDENSVLFLANVSFFAFVLAILAFFLFAITKPWTHEKPITTSLTIENVKDFNTKCFSYSNIDWELNRLTKLD